MEAAIYQDGLPVESETIETLHLVAVNIDPTLTETYTQQLRASGVAAHCLHVTSVTELEQSCKKNGIDIVLAAPDTSPSLHQVFGTMQAGAADASLVLYGSPPSDNEFDYIIRTFINPDDSRRGPAILLREFHDVVTRRRVKQLEEQLAHVQAQCNSLISSSQDAIGYIHAGMHLRANSAYMELFEIAKDDEIEAITVMDLITPKARPEIKRFLRLAERSPKPMSIDTECTTLDGRSFQATLEFSTVQIDGENCTQLIIKKQVEESSTPVDEAPSPDTPIYDKSDSILESVAKSFADSAHQYSLIYVGLKDFLTISDAAGILATEAILDETANLLRESLGDADKLGRLGEHGFVIIHQINGLTPCQLAEKLIKLVDDHVFKVNGEFVHPKVSVGLVTSDQFNTKSAQDSIDHAYQAYLTTTDDQRVAQYKPKETTEAATVTKMDAVAEDDVIGLAITRNKIEPKWQGMLSTKGMGHVLSYYVRAKLLDEKSEEMELSQIHELLEDSERNTLFDHMLLKQTFSKIPPTEGSSQMRVFVELSTGSVKDANFSNRIEQMLAVSKHSPKQLVCLFSADICRKHQDDVKAATISLKEKGILTYISDYGIDDDDFEILNSLPVEGIVWAKISEKLTASAKNAHRQSFGIKIQQIQDAGYRSVLPDIESAESLARSWGLGIDYLMGSFIHKPSDNPDFDASHYQ